ncbi:hypothetical protein ES705_35643 [subsurface metagenome]
MKKIKTEELESGMRFSKPVYFEEGNMLVPADKPLKERDIERLLKWGVAEVQTEGKMITKAEADSGEADESLSWLKHGEMKYIKLYQSMIEEINSILGDVASGVNVKHDSIDNVAYNILDKVRESKNDLVQLIQRGAGSQREIAAGSVNCAVLSTVIGMSMKISGHRLIQLVTGILLHDIGMVRVPKEILNKSEKLTAEELQQVRTHPLYGYRIISKELKYPEDVAVIALQHQERWDGKGYPRGIRGEDIVLPARIAAVADAYEAMINIRPYRSSLIGYSAMKGILSDNGKHFDPQVLKAFLESVGIYPVGSILQLNNSSIGRVAANQKAAPLRPKIELLVDEYGVRVTERGIIDLLEKKKLFIVKAIDPRTVNE